VQPYIIKPKIKIVTLNKLSKNEIQARIKGIDHAWVLKNNAISRVFRFQDFVQAFSFMTSVALIAEKYVHHPNWENIYNKVIITLKTHDVDGLTVKDFQLAQEIDQIINISKFIH
jgi:4a-hydroxytetrahydrobiopterin dehydratase